jgi:hypothetical protein
MVDSISILQLAVVLYNLARQHTWLPWILPVQEEQLRQMSQYLSCGLISCCDKIYAYDPISPNYVNRMRQVYAGLPNVRVAPLHFAPEDISGERLLAIMKVDSDTRKLIVLPKGY